MKKIKKILIFFLLIILIFFLALASYLFIGKVDSAEKITWGANFSQNQSQDLGLDWKENYLSLMDDLGIKNLKISVPWDAIEPKQDKFFFDDLDWQIEKAAEREARILLVIGRKTPRWPECHIPQWAKNLTEKEQQKEILQMLEKIVLRYKAQSSIWAWQVENEPFFKFGECPELDKDFLGGEIKLVKSLDPERPVLLSDSGEGSFWIQVAGLADIIGTTIYEKVWFNDLKIYVRYPFPPVFYWRKAQIIKKIFKKETICVELQAEPWGPSPLSNLTPEEQEKTMDLEQMKKNIAFAQKTGLEEFYLWGAEWWYWMKIKQNNPEFWNEAKKLFSQNSN